LICLLVELSASFLRLRFVQNPYRVSHCSIWRSLQPWNVDSLHDAGCASWPSALWIDQSVGNNFLTDRSNAFRRLFRQTFRSESFSIFYNFIASQHCQVPMLVYVKCMGSCAALKTFSRTFSAAATTSCLLEKGVEPRDCASNLVSRTRTFSKDWIRQ